MNLSDCIHILNEYNKWRRGKAPYTGLPDDSKPPSPHDIGLAIDYAIRRLEGLKK